MERNNTMETTILEGRTLHIRDGKNFELKVVAGCLWVTQDQDREDKVIDAGETFRVTRNGLTLAHAFKDVRIQIACSAQAGMPTLTLGGGYRTTRRRHARTRSKITRGSSISPVSKMCLPVSPNLKKQVW